MRTLITTLLLTTTLVGCVSQAKYAQLESQLEACRNKKGGGGGGGGGSGGGGGGAETRRALLEQLKPLVDRGILEVEDYDGRTVIGMRSEVLFPSGSWELSPDGKATIREVGKALNNQTNTRWQIEGHTDNDPMQGNLTNWELGANRALAVLHVMVEAGMSSDRLSAATFGEFNPVVKNDTDEHKAKNRRIEIVLLRDFRAAKQLE
jgi:chemotaxis protein MotB